MMPGSSGAPHGSAAGVKAMSVEQITNCAKRVKGLQEDTARLTTQDARMKGQKASIEAAQKAIEADRSRVNIKNAKQVEAFNRRVEQNLEAIRRLNADVADVNTWVSAHGILINDYKVSCVQRPYRKSDLALLPSDLRAAMESVSASTDIPILDEAETRAPVAERRAGGITVGK